MQNIGKKEIWKKWRNLKQSSPGVSKLSYSWHHSQENFSITQQLFIHISQKNKLTQIEIWSQESLEGVLPPDTPIVHSMLCHSFSLHINFQVWQQHHLWCNWCWQTFHLGCRGLACFLRWVPSALLSPHTLKDNWQRDFKMFSWPTSNQTSVGQNKY